MPLLFCLIFLVWNPLAAQITRPKEVRELAKGGSDAITQLQPLLKSADLDLRVEAVKAIVEIGTQRSIDPLIEATRKHRGAPLQLFVDRVAQELLEASRNTEDFTLLGLEYR